MKFLLHSFNTDTIAKAFKSCTPKALTSFIATVYLLVMFAVYPFYLKEGYVGAGASKYRFFLYSSIVAVLLLLLTGLVELIKSFNHFIITDAFIMGFVIVTLISYFISPFRATAFLGADGWYMGLVTLILICVIYVLISRLWEFDVIVVYAALIFSALVYLIGILDRFSIYILPFAVRNPSFISTIGNINWFMGYYSVITPIGVGIFLYELKHGTSMKRRWALLAYVFIAFMAGFAQGSESIFLFLAALFTGLLFLCYKDIFNLKDIFLLTGIMGLAAQIIRVMRLVYPEGYNYQTDGPCAYFTSSTASLIIVIIAVIIWQLLARFEELNKYAKIVIWAIWILEVIAFLAFIVIGILKTNTNLIAGFNYSLFYFNERFGSERGVAYKATIDGLRELPFIGILFGVGPDAFVEYVYSVPTIDNYLRSIWPNQPLTNAHCEMLNMLVNEGIIGMLVYLGIFLSFLTNTIRGTVGQKALPSSDSEHRLLKLCISLSIFCYLVHNLISFGQVMNTPYIFILMGISRAIDLLSESFDKIG